MKVNRIGLALLFLLCGSSASAESLYKYRVQLTDKSKSVHSLEHPETFLSERALARRASQGVAVDSTDLPVCRAYIERLESQGGKYISSSKWNNTVLMQVPDEAVALRLWIIHLSALSKKYGYLQIPLCPVTKTERSR